MANEIIQFNDPFNPDDRTIIAVESGLSAYSVLSKIDYDVEIYDVVISKNNEIIDCDFIIDDNDIIMFALVPKGGGGGKSILATVALIAIAIAAPYAAGAAVGLSSAGMVGASIGSVYAMGGLGAAMIYGGVMVGTMVLGGMLVNSLFKPNVPSAQSGLENFENSPTYGFNVAGNQLQQGQTVPVLYGKTKITPQFTGKKITTVDNKQYLGLLMALCEGPVDLISDVTVNDEPIGNFSSVQMVSRAGTNDQDLIPEWGDTWSDVAVSKNLTDTTTWIEGRISGDAVTKLNIGLTAPMGLFYANDAGGLDTYSVKLSVEYRVVGGAWTSILSSVALPNVRYIYIDKTPTKPSGSTLFYPDQTGPFEKWKVIGIDPWNATNQAAEYVGDVTDLPTNVTLKTMTWDNQIVWTYVSNEATTPYYLMSGKSNSPIRKTISLIGLVPDQYEIRMKFYEQPSSGTRYGSDIMFDYLQEGIEDDFIYPNTALLSLEVLATDQLSGGIPRISAIVKRTTGVYGSLDNPAWATLDLMMNTRYGAGIPITRIDWASFEDWAAYCDDQNFKVNIYLDQTLTLSQSLTLIGGLGRGSVIQYGSTFTAIVDKPNISPVQGFLFSMGNIIQNSFNESFLPLKDRSNIIEVSYYDESENYQKTSVEVSQSNYDLVSMVNKSQINLIGCVSRDQALKQAKYHLNQNRYLTMTASWEASIDAIHCRVGDIVNVAHDVPQWGHSGRIISASGSTVELDRVDLGPWNPAKQYYVQISNSLTDTQLFHRVSSVNDGVLTLQTALTETVGEYSVYSFGEVNRHAKQMRVISITTAGSLNRKITAIEYNGAVYSDTVVIEPPVVVTDLGITNVKISDFIRLSKSGAIETVVSMSWSGVSLGYNVSYIENVAGSQLVSIGTVRENYVEFTGPRDGRTYTFNIDDKSVIYTVLGKTVAPDPVTNLRGSESANVFTIEWDYAFTPVDFKEFGVYYSGSLIGTTTAKTFTTKTIPSISSATFTIKPKDTSGNVGPEESVTINVTPVPSVGTITGTVSDGKLNLSWSYSNKPSDFSHYVIRFGSEYVGESVTEKFIGTPKNHLFGTIVYSVVSVDIAGNESIPTNVSLSFSAPVISAITQSFNLNDLTLGWAVSLGAYSITKFTVSGSNGDQITSVNKITFPANWLGGRLLTITGTDSAGNTFSAQTTVTITAPSTPVIASSVSITSGIEFSWVSNVGTCGIQEYLVSYNGNQIVTKDTFYFIPTALQGSYTLQVTAKDYAGNLSSAGSKTVTIALPSVQNISATTGGRDIVLKWDATVGSFNIKDYKIEYTNGASQSIVAYSTTKDFVLTPDWVGLKTFTVTPRDLAGNFGTSVQFNHTVVAPNAPVVTSEIVGKDLVLTIAQTARSFDLGPVEINYDSTTITSNSGTPTWSIPIFWDLGKTFNITSIDVLGNRSTASQINVNILEAVVSSVNAEVVDNNVLLRWTGQNGTLPIDFYEITRGADYATSILVGFSKSTFATLFESDAGTYTYWVTPVDTAGNKGQYVGIVTSVSQPPDFILNVEWDSDWTGTKTNVKIGDNGKGVVPINLTETYEGHFTSRSWTTPQNQIDAGFPLWLSPSSGSASYTQIFDYGVLLGSTNITLTDPITTKNGSGNYTVTRQIFVSSDGVSYTAQPINTMMVFVSNIRYVKVTYSWTVDTNTILEVGNFHLRLDSKIKNDGGTGTAVSTDVGGTVVLFNIPFVDITSINVTPKGTTAIIPVYDFLDAPNPTQFKVLLYNTTGTRVNGEFSWSAKGY